MPHKYFHHVRKGWTANICLSCPADCEPLESKALRISYLWHWHLTHIEDRCSVVVLESGHSSFFLSICSGLTATSHKIKQFGHSLVKEQLKRGILGRQGTTFYTPHSVPPQCQEEMAWKSMCLLLRLHLSHRIIV